MAGEAPEKLWQMARMHDEYIERLEKAVEKKNYIEASWLCYSIIEQRITRMIDKHISFCPRAKKTKGKPAAISTRISCIKYLIEKNYGGYANLDNSLMSELTTWCNNRNELVHGLVSLEHYKQYDAEFKSLAERGYPLVKRLYVESGKLREWSRKPDSQFGPFPKKKCKCEYRCIFER